MSPTDNAGLNRMLPQWQSAGEWNLWNFLLIYLLFEQDSYRGVKIQQTETQVKSCAVAIVFNLLSDSLRWTRQYEDPSSYFLQHCKTTQGAGLLFEWILTKIFTGQTKKNKQKARKIWKFTFWNELQGWHTAEKETSFRMSDCLYASSALFWKPLTVYLHF